MPAIDHLTAAVLAGATSFATITRWARHHGRALLVVMGGSRVFGCGGIAGRGAKESDGDQSHLLAGMDHFSGNVVGQAQPAATINRILRLP